MDSSTLYVKDLPNLTEMDFISLFRDLDGFRSARLRQSVYDHSIGFVEFDTPDQASRAMERMQAYKFSSHDRGITVQLSHSQKRKRDDREGGRDTRERDRDARDNRDSRDTRDTRFPLPYNPPFEYEYPPAFRHPLPHPPPYMYSHTPAPPPPLPADSACTLFVEGLPEDATAREMSHIFRHFPGYVSLRLVPKDSKVDSSKVYKLCFVEYETKYQATAALASLNHYRMDEHDTRGLHIAYAKGKDRERERERELRKERDRERDRDRTDKGRERKRPKERDTNEKERDKERERDRSNEKTKERDDRQDSGGDTHMRDNGRERNYERDNAEDEELDLERDSRDGTPEKSDYDR